LYTYRIFFVKKKIAGRENKNFLIKFSQMRGKKKLTAGCPMNDSLKFPLFFFTHKAVSPDPAPTAGTVTWLVPGMASF
jgi:hypothetical protein